MFYHQEQISPPKIQENDIQKTNRDRSRRSDNRKRYSGYSLMPNKKYIELLLRNYQVDFSLSEQVANRATNRLTIKPLFCPRFGINVWFDQITSHILKREIVFYQPDREDLIFHSKFLVDFEINEKTVDGLRGDRGNLKISHVLI